MTWYFRSARRPMSMESREVQNGARYAEFLADKDVMELQSVVLMVIPKASRRYERVAPPHSSDTGVERRMVSAV